MKTVSKKLLSLLLVAFLLVSALPFQSFAAEFETPAEEIPAPAVEAPAIEDPVVEAPVVEAPVEGAPVLEHPAPHEHQLSCVSLGGNQHKYECVITGCDYETAPAGCSTYLYSNEQHLCTECHGEYVGALEDGHLYVTVAGSAVEPTCQTEGKEADKKCTLCGKTKTGAALPLGDHVDADGDNSCDVCGQVISNAPVNVTFYINADNQQFLGMGADTKAVVKVWNKGSSSYDVPSVVETKYAKFLGFYTEPVGGTLLNTSVPFSGTNTEFYAHWQVTTYPVNVYRIINKNVNTAKLLKTLDLTPDALLYEAVVNAGFLSYSEPGYTLALGGGYENPVMKYVGNTFVSIGAGDYAAGGFNVYLNMVPSTYNLILNANGGIVTPGKLTDVAFNSTITLPTPRKEGSVFGGWMDINGEVHPAGKMVYTFQMDTTFTAVWNDELTVMLKVYINGDTSSAPRIYPLSQLIKDSKVFRSDVEGIINSNYVSSGGTMVVYGLYSDKTWNNGQISVDGNPFVEVGKENGVNYIYVMLMNAAPKNTIVTNPSNSGAYWVSNGNGTGYWVTPNFGTNTPYIYSNGLNGAYWVNTGNSGYWVYPGNIILNGTTNPKTGDTAMIEVAAAVMILAAAALVVTMGLRKRKVQ